jgi:hypothetical protein
MNRSPIKLIDPARRVLAIGHITEEGDHFGGILDLRNTPHYTRAIFEEFEEIVSGQVFSCLDEIQARIRALGITVAFDNGREVCAGDLQVFPSTGDFSFTRADVAATRAKLA